MSRARSSYAVLLVFVVAALLAATLGTTATAAVGSDRFVPGQPYRGDFPDPWIMKSGDTYYAYATNTANLSLPVMTSRDLVTWTAYGNGLPRAAGWAATSYARGRAVTRTWAPSVTFVDGRYVLAYTAPLSRARPRKNCVSVATASQPQGPFIDSTSAPIVCPADQGAIDPQVFVADGGKPYLIWKTEGVVGREPTKVWSQRLVADGTALADGSEANELLQTAVSWEGHVVENPAMIRIQGLNYLFYSANEYAGPNYAIGYAVCQSVEGPCTRPTDTPLLASGDAVSGPGGPAPFVGPDGQLRLGYAAWSYGRTGYPRSGRCRPNCNQRRLHVARLAIDPEGLLHVTDRG